MADQGVGIPVEVRDNGVGNGFGLPMIDSIATSVAFADPAGGKGTEITMALPLGRPDEPTAVDGATPGVDPAERILRRLVAVVAAQRDMSSERVMEGLLLAELVARNALRYLIGDKVAVHIDFVGEGFELRVGPLEPGGAQAVIDDSEVPVIGSVLERLADEVRVDHGRRRRGHHAADEPARLRPQTDLGGVVDHLELTVGAGQFHHPRHPPAAAHHHQAGAAVALLAVQRQHQPQAAGVQELDPAEVQHQHAGLLAHAGTNSFLDTRDGRHVDLAGQGSDGAERAFRDFDVEEAHWEGAYIPRGRPGGCRRAIPLIRRPPTRADTTRAEAHRARAPSDTRSGGTQPMQDEAANEELAPEERSSRSQFLKIAGGTGAAGALAIFLAACGDDDSSSSSDSGDKTEKIELGLRQGRHRDRQLRPDPGVPGGRLLPGGPGLRRGQGQGDRRGRQDHRRGREPARRRR